MLVKIKDARRERFEIEEGRRVRFLCPRCNVISIAEWDFESPFIGSADPGWRCLSCKAFFPTSITGLLARDFTFYEMPDEKHYLVGDDEPYYKLKAHFCSGIDSSFANWDEFYRSIS